MAPANKCKKNEQKKNKWQITVLFRGAAFNIEILNKAQDYIVVQRCLELQSIIMPHALYVSKKLTWACPHVFKNIVGPVYPFRSMCGSNPGREYFSETTSSSEVKSPHSRPFLWSVRQRRWAGKFTKLGLSQHGDVWFSLWRIESNSKTISLSF